MKFAVAVLCVFAACGDSSPKQPDAPAAADAPAIDAPSVPLVAPSPIIVASAQFTTPTPNEVVTSLIFVNPSVGASGVRNTEHLANCYLSDCLHPITHVLGVPGGTISVTNGTTTLTGTPNANGYYVPQVVMAATPTWTPGNTLTLMSTGAQVPAFSTTLTVPAAASLTSPPTMIDHTQPLTLTWTGGVGTVLVVIVHLGGTTEEYDDLRIVCEFSGAAGTGTIPAEVMARMSTHNSAALTLGNADIKHVMVGTQELYAYTLNGQQLPPFLMVQ